MTRFLLLPAAILALILWPFKSNAHHSKVHVTNNYYDVTEITEVVEVQNYDMANGVSERDLASGLSMAMAIGGHQFDFGYADLQLSLTGAYELDGEEENAYSFAGAIRPQFLFKGKVLTHFAYTESGGDKFIMFGGTFRP